MQEVPYSTLEVGKKYRIHKNGEPPSKDTIGTFSRIIDFDGDIRADFNNIIEPNHGVRTRADGSYPHIRQPENILRRFPVATTTFYETAANMDVQRVVASATNHLVQTPLIRKYFGGKRKTKRRKLRR
jgi:hypothetical protein